MNEPNPYLTMPDSMADVQKKIAESRPVNPHALEHEQWAYDVFVKNESGIKLLEYLEGNFLRGLAAFGGVPLMPDHPQMANIAIWIQGRDWLLKLLRHWGEAHQKRVLTPPSV